MTEEHKPVFQKEFDLICDSLPKRKAKHFKEQYESLFVDLSEAMKIINDLLKQKRLSKKRIEAYSNLKHFVGSQLAEIRGRAVMLTARA